MMQGNSCQLCHSALSYPFNDSEKQVKTKQTNQSEIALEIAS